MTGRQDLFEESMRLGNTAAWELNWDRAVEYYRKALAEFPEHPEALTNLGLALLELDRLEDALQAYQRAAEIVPDNPIPVEKCAEIYERMGRVREAIERREAAADLHIRRRDVDKAIDNWNHIARLAPGNIAVRSRLALTYERIGRRKEAVYEYINLASILQRTGKLERAMEALQRALGLIPGHPEAARAMRLLRQGKPLPEPTEPRAVTSPLRMEEAQTFLQAQEEGDEEKPADDQDDPEVAAQKRALSILASLLFDEPETGSDGGNGRGASMSAITQGLTEGRRGVGGKPSMVRYLGEAIDLQTHGHTRQAVKEFERAISAGLDHPAAHYNMGLLLKEMGEYEQARQHLMAAIGHPDLALGANLALGRLARMQEDLPEAARYLLQALRIADGLSVGAEQSTQLNQLYDTILASQNEGDEEALSRIVESTLSFLSGPEWLQRIRKARKQLQPQASEGPVIPLAEMLAVGASDRVLQALGRIDDLAARGLYASAMEEALLTLEHVPTYLALHTRIAELMIKSGNLENGLKKLGVVADTHSVRGEVQQAVDVYRKILEYSPVNLEARSHMIDMLAQLNRIDEALDQYLELADIYRQLARLDDAQRTLQQAHKLSQRGGADRKRVLVILQQMADMHLARLDWPQALRAYEEIRDIDPENDKARLNIIDLNLRLGQEDQAAEELDLYLEHLVQAGRGSEALDLLEELTRVHPGKQTLHSRLAEAYRAAGRKADAIAQYDALGELQLDSGQVQEAIRTIRTIIDLGPPDPEGYRELLRNLEAGQV